MDTESTDIAMGKGMDTDQSWAGYGHWIDLISYMTNRLYYRDQSVYSFCALERFARELSPSVVVELGTLSGMSCRTWLHSCPQARIVCVDLSFEPLKNSMNILPLDIERLTLVQNNILEVEFAQFWTPSDRVLLFVDAHDLPQAPIMRYLIDNAVPRLPAGSMVVVDDIWYSPETLTAETAPAFLRHTVMPEIDPLGCFDGHYAPYHEGGSFMGFAEVVPLLEYANACKLPLHFDRLAKNVSFSVPVPAPEPYFDADQFAACCGVVHHNPLMPDDASASYAADMRRFATLYASAGPSRTEQLLMEQVEHGKAFPGLAYAMAVCRARQGDPAGALRLLETPGADALPQATILRRDLAAFLNPLCQSSDRQARRSGVTLFTIPKAFLDHTGRIQRNAIESWTHLHPRPDIILFGDDPGTAETAARLGVRHVPDIVCNDFGTPLIDGVFKAAQEMSETDLVAYVNADIILLDDFMRACDIARASLTEFLMIGQRQDYTLLDDIDFSLPDWALRLRADAQAKGIRHAETGIDYFVFVPGLWPRIPPFAIGRTVFDNWLLSAAHQLGKPVVDATDAVFAIHQSHGYGHVRDGLKGIDLGIEARRNKLLAGRLDKYLTSDASHAINASGALESRTPRVPSYLSWNNYTHRLRWLLQQGKAFLPVKPEDVADILEECTQKLDEILKRWRPVDNNNIDDKKNRKLTWFSASLLGDHAVHIATECAEELGVNVWTGKDGKLRDEELAVLTAVYERIQRRNKPIVFDVGANTGLVALLPSVKNDLIVFAFEPNPAVFNILKKNIALNDLEGKVHCFPLAFTDHVGTERLKIPAGHTGLSCLGNPQRFRQWSETTVPVTTLDGFVADHGISRIDLVKIDTEGCELHILQGGRECIEKYKPDLLVECWEENTRQFGYSTHDLRRYIEDMGYNFTMITQEDALCIHHSKNS